MIEEGDQAPANDVLAQYRDAKALADAGVPLRVLVQAAMLTDDEDSLRLQKAYPLLWEETMARRFHSTDGSLPGDQQGEEDPPKIESLGRD